MLSASAHAQSVLNFARTTVNERVNAGIAVTNPTANFADVTFTLYGLDGHPVSSGLVNPVRHRVAPRGQVSMMASELFAGPRADGWVQATSTTSGLLGYYTAGDSVSTLEGSEAASTAFVSQLIPLVREDQGNRTELVVLNPGVTSGSIAITVYNTNGEEVGRTTGSLSSHEALRIPVSTLLTPRANGNLSVRVSSSIPVSASAFIERDGALIFAAGQSTEQPATTRVAPHFIAGGGYDSVLVLANPSNSQVSVTVTLFSENGGPVSAATSSSPVFTIPANGSISVETSRLTGLPSFTPGPVNGWLRIDSPSISLSGLMILDQGQGVTAVPLQTSAADRMVYSHISDTNKLSTGLALINSSAAEASLTLSLVSPDGVTFSQTSFSIPANSKYSAMLRDIAPALAGKRDGYIHIRSTVPLWGLGTLSAPNGVDFVAAVPAIRVPDTFAPGAIPVTPGIVSAEPAEVQAGTTVQVAVSNLAGDAAFSIGGQAVQSRPIAPGFPRFILTVPALEPGFVKLRVRSNGVESAPVLLRVLPADNQPTRTISGQAFYQKIDVTNAGLDLSHPAMFPIRNGRVEVYDRIGQSLVAVSDTDLEGKFEVPVPMSPSLMVRVVSRLRSGEARVLDNTNANVLYSISAEIDGREFAGKLLLADNSRVSGAFNILEMIQRSNDLVRTAEPNLPPPQVAIFWSTRNSRRTVGTTYFNVGNNTAFVLGDRSDPQDSSDEYDDSVIVHEYAHALAARFSRDDSPGGAHGMGDILDPRVAWSEGWANFFACAVLNDPVFRDAGPNGLTLRYDLEETTNDNSGYWSEASIQTLLWDLFDDRIDAADNVQYPFSLIWGAFRDLQNDRFVYLPYFLDHFLERNPAATETLRSMVQFRSIYFQPNVRPSVTNPFPRVVDVGETVAGFVDSLSSRRSNLMQSSHFLVFTTGGGNASIRLEITGAGPAGNPAANDLDLFLMDTNGRVLDKSDRGLNGQSELISVRLPANTYILEVRSYYTKAETGGVVFNSGDYRLSVLVQ